MRLTRLEIKGFKSFGDRVVINFNEGITGIVGPNGCGKSNVVDAIRWVLGEQKTRALRSDKMENIIFNGTKNRKASQLAEVSLTFDNTKNLLPTEYSQITITRRYYRSGDSEYELNGIPCRLKDITGLFMDTGIASNSYAIIELKMIDELLNDKDNSRRALFEEAAGISKFKSHKKQTLKKLEDTDADLERVEDLLYEIEKNLKSLERQAKQAERYYKLKAEYKETSINLAKVKVKDQQLTKHRLEGQIKQEEDRQTAVASQRAEAESLLATTKSGIIEAEKLLASRQKTLNAHVGNIRQLESEKKLKNERLRFLYDRKDALQSQQQEDSQSLERVQFALEKLSGEINSLGQLVSEAELLVQQKQEQKVTIQSQSNQQKQLTTELSQRQKSLQEEVYRLQKEVELNQLQQSSLRQELERTTQDTQERTSRLSHYEEKLGDLRSKVALAEEEVATAKSRQQKQILQISEAEEDLNQAQGSLQKNRRQLDVRQNEYALTKSLVDNLEGFPEAIKFLKKQTQWGKQAPLLSDVFTSEEKYRVALETFLEPYLNYYIVDTVAQAKEAIALLDEATRGRANFFALELLEKKAAKPTPAAAANQVPALEVIEFDSRFKSLAQHLFASVFFTTEDGASLTNENIELIHVSGKLIKRNYSLSGGSVGLFEGKRIGRAKNLENLKKEIQQLQKTVTKEEAETAKKQETLKQLKSVSYQRELDEKSGQLNRLQQEFIQVDTEFKQVQQLLQNQSDKQEDLSERLAELQDRFEVNLPAYQEKKDLLETIFEEAEEANFRYQEISEQLNTASEAFNQQNIQFHQVNNQLQRLQQEHEFKTSSLQTTKSRLERSSEEASKIASEIQELLQRNEVGDDDLKALYEERNAIEEAVNEAEKSYYHLRGEVDAIEKNLREIQRQRESAQALGIELNNKLHELSLQLSSVYERISVEFGEEALKSLSVTDDIEDLPTAEELLGHTQELREKIERIGPINPMAMEAYEEIKERHTFISTQREDLINAKQALVETMEQLDDAARIAFLDAFEKIKTNFVRVFRSLFTEEDDCDLRLVQPDKPLESAIDIVAKPKGKRPLTINQLSGGEKTLTATSLLFSIYLLKPAPFCIFDEVDAPLDDANIDKFNNIIRKFSEESQFIIVTHNKRTMASTDIMYGVTMLEQGVSRVVPVDLRELEATL